MSDEAANALPKDTPRLPPLGAPMSAKYVDSFAHTCMKDRLPKNIAKTVDSLVRNKKICVQEYKTFNIMENIRDIIACLVNKLRYEILTNKAFTLIKDNGGDVDLWNEHIREVGLADDNTPRWFNTQWLLAECYAFRRIVEGIRLHGGQNLADFDIFRFQKQQSCLESMDLMVDAVVALKNMGGQRDYDVFNYVLSLSLWGNKRDLTLPQGDIFSFNPAKILEELRPHILVNHSDAIWQILTNGSKDSVDIITDNAGYEVFGDLLLADFITSHNLADKVRFRVKCMPWFISDVNKNDIFWILEEIGKHVELQPYAVKWKEFFQITRVWEIKEDPFWTCPHDYSYVKSKAPSLYSDLTLAKLVIFKGDLNFRKLVGDRNWDPLTPFEKALRGFHPTNVVSLRSIKADVIVGLAEGDVEKCNEEDPLWMFYGKWGTILFCSRIDK